jgi:hypothetical protein
LVVGSATVVFVLRAVRSAEFVCDAAFAASAGATTAAAAMALPQKKWRRDASGAARGARCRRDTSSGATLCAATSSSARQPFVLMRGQGQAARSHASESKQGIDFCYFETLWCFRAVFVPSLTRVIPLSCSGNFVRWVQ